MKDSQKSFKELRTFAQRVREFECVREKHPTRIPIVIERYGKETQLPAPDWNKFLIPGHLSVGELIQLLRRRLQLESSQSIFLMVNGRSLPATSAIFANIYRSESDPDGFLYIVYASQESFG